MIEEIIFTIFLLWISIKITALLLPKKDEMKYIPLPQNRVGQILYTTDLIKTDSTKFYTPKEFFGSVVNSSESEARIKYGRE